MYFIEIVGQDSRKNKNFVCNVGDFSLLIFEKKTHIILVFTVISMTLKAATCVAHELFLSVVKWERTLHEARVLLGGR